LEKVLSPKEKKGETGREWGSVRPGLSHKKISWSKRTPTTEDRWKKRSPEKESVEVWPKKKVGSHADL